MSRPDFRLARFPLTRGLLAAAASLLLVPPVANAQAAWMRIGDPPNAPKFNSYAAVYDPVDDRLLVYSPERAGSSAPEYVADIWELRLGDLGSGWRLLSTVGAAPIGRLGCAVAFDPVARRLLLYGGWGYYSSDNDLWSLSLAGTPTWSHVPTTGERLPPRYDPFLFVDEAARQIVLFGGSTSPPELYPREAWTLPLDSSPIWAPVPVSNSPPSMRNYTQCAWDAQRRRILVHGGMTLGYDPLGDTWALTLGDPGRWDPIATTGLQVARGHGGALVDAVGDRLVLGPGFSDTYPSPASERDAYTLPLAAGGEWSAAPAKRPFDLSGYSPVGLTYETVYDSRRHRMIAITATYAQSLSLTDDSGWQRLWPPDPPREPSVVTGHVLVSDPARQVVWSVGGEEQYLYQDLWKLDPAGEAQWAWYAQSHRLPWRGHAAALDQAGQRILVVSLGQTQREIIELDIEDIHTETVWAPAGAHPAERVEQSAVVDPVRGRLLVFGGNYYGPQYSGNSFADLWSVPLGDLSAWTLLTPSGPGPGARGSHFAFYDDVRDRMVLFGGFSQSGGPIRRHCHDAWALSLAGEPAWTLLDAAAWDPPFAGRLTYDPMTRRLFLFRADPASASAIVATRGIQDGDSWATLATSGDPPLADAPIAFAPWCDRLVVASTNRSGPQADETWVLQLERVGPARVRRPIREPGGHPRGLEGGQAGDGLRVPGEAGAHGPLPIAPSFTVNPSPSRGAARMSFTLPSASRVTIELFDVRGARVMSRDLGVQPAGEHAWTWPQTSALAPGLYMARLTTGAGRIEAKVLLLP